MSSEFDPARIVQQMRAEDAARRAERVRASARRSKLDAHKFVIRDLYAAGASYPQIARWLTTQGVRVHPGTIRTYMRRLMTQEVAHD